MSTFIFIIWMIILFIVYHSIFTVYYFSLGNGLLREVVVIAALASVMTYITLSLWWIMTLVVLYFGYSSYKKSGKKKILIASIICALLFSAWANEAKNSYAADFSNANNYKLTECK